MITIIKYLIYYINYSPVSPEKYDWSTLYPEAIKNDPTKLIEFADIGCGYGGLLGCILNVTCALC